MAGTVVSPLPLDQALVQLLAVRGVTGAGHVLAVFGSGEGDKQ